jgi:hypothetical protein
VRDRIDSIGHTPQGKLAQSNQVRLAEETLDGGGRLLGHIDLARFQACDQILRRQIDELDLIGFIENPVGNRFALAHAGDLRHQIVETLEVLDVDRGPDVDALIEQLLDILPTLGVTRRRIAFDAIGVGQLIDDQNGRPSFQSRIEIELAPHRAPIFDRHRRQLLESFEQSLGLDASMRLDIPDHDVAAARTQATRSFEHRVRLADPGTRAKEDAQFAAPGFGLLRLDGGQELVGIGTCFDHLAS